MKIDATVTKRAVPSMFTSGWKIEKIEDEKSGPWLDKFSYFNYKFIFNHSPWHQLARQIWRFAGPPG